MDNQTYKNYFDNKYGNTFCVKPFTEIASTPKGGIKLCCYSEGIGVDNSYHNGNLKDVFNTNENLNQARQDLLNGKKIKPCQACWNDEKSTGYSARLDYNRSLERTNPELLDAIKDKGTVELRSIDIKFGNKCNYACVMCDSSNSSLWGKEVEKNPLPQGMWQGQFDTKTWDFPKEKVQELLDMSSTLTRIKSTGGEPLLLDEFKMFVKSLVDKGYAKNIIFKTVTNGTVDCSDLLPYMNEFKTFHMDWSVDGTDEVYNYVRWPGNFERMRRVHEKLADSINKNNYSNIEIEMHPTIQLFNLHNLSDIVKYAQSLGIVKMVDFGYIHFEPKYLDTAIFPDKMLSDIIQNIDNSIESYTQPNTYNNLKLKLFSNQNRIKNKKEMFAKTKQIVNWFESTRNINIYDHISTYKELEDYYAKS